MIEEGKRVFVIGRVRPIGNGRVIVEVKTDRDRKERLGSRYWRYDSDSEVTVLA